MRRILSFNGPVHGYFQILIQQKEQCIKRLQRNLTSEKHLRGELETDVRLKDDKIEKLGG